MSVELIEAAADRERAVIRHLYPLYLHDLSAFTDLYTVDEEGRFFPDYLSDWLETRSAPVHPLVIRADGRPAGFALVAEAPYPHMTPGRDYRMSEMFILKAHRRRGVGRAAALACFQRFRGVWEVSQLPANEGAIAFWRSVIGEHTGGRFREETIDGGPGQVFRS